MEAQRGLCGKGKSWECEPDPATGSRGASGSHFRPAPSKHDFVSFQDLADPCGNPGENKPPEIFLLEQPMLGSAKGGHSMDKRGMRAQNDEF